MANSANQGVVGGQDQCQTRTASPLSAGSAEVRLIASFPSITTTPVNDGFGNRINSQSESFENRPPVNHASRERHKTIVRHRAATYIAPSYSLQQAPQRTFCNEGNDAPRQHTHYSFAILGWGRRTKHVVSAKWGAHLYPGTEKRQTPPRETDGPKAEKKRSLVVVRALRSADILEQRSRPCPFVR